MAQDKDALDAAIQAQNAVIADIATKVTKIASDVDALLAKIAGGTPAADLATEVQAIQSQTASLQSVADSLGATDTKASA